MVSVDHFAHELRTQFRKAADQGAMGIVITSRELCQSLRNANHSTRTCCEAMHGEVRPGDLVLVGEDSGEGMAVRYLLPREG